MNYTEEQFSKLPKWAQAEINRLQGNNESLTEKVNQINGDSETNTHIANWDNPQPLPKNSRIQFTLGQNKLEVYIKENYVEVHSNSYPEDVYVAPSSSNIFRIGFAKIYRP